MKLLQAVALLLLGALLANRFSDADRAQSRHEPHVESVIQLDFELACMRETMCYWMRSYKFPTQRFWKYPDVDPRGKTPAQIADIQEFAADWALGMGYVYEEPPEQASQSQVLAKLAALELKMEQLRPGREALFGEPDQRRAQILARVIDSLIVQHRVLAANVASSKTPMKSILGYCLTSVRRIKAARRMLRGQRPFPPPTHVRPEDFVADRLVVKRETPR